MGLVASVKGCQGASGRRGLLQRARGGAVFFFLAALQLQNRPMLQSTETQE